MPGVIEWVRRSWNNYAVVQTDENPEGPHIWIPKSFGVPLPGALVLMTLYQLAGRWHNRHAVLDANDHARGLLL